MDKVFSKLTYVLVFCGLSVLMAACQAPDLSGAAGANKTRQAPTPTELVNKSNQPRVLVVDPTATPVPEPSGKIAFATSESCASGAPPRMKKG